MKIGFLQFNPVYKDKDANLEYINQSLSDKKADLIVLPELCTTGYLFSNKDELFSLSEEYACGTTFDLMSALAKQNQCHYVFGYSEKLGNQMFNSSALVGPDGVIGNYRKVHLFYKEKLIFDSGDIGFNVFNVGDVKVGIMICFDWIFPESARTLSLKGAQLICHPTNLVLPYCQKAMYTRAIENRVYTITANRYGCESDCDGTLTFSGNSIIYSPKGEILASASGDDDSFITVDVDPQLANDDKQITEYNHIFTDRKTEYYVAFR